MADFLNKKKDLLTWIKDCESKFDEKNYDLDEDKKDFFKKIYEDSNHIRKYFFENYLNNITDNLNTKSNKDSYQYKDFFKLDNQSDVKNKYFSMFEEKEKKNKENKQNKKYEYKGKENIKDNFINKKENYFNYYTSKYKKKNEEKINENKNDNIYKDKYKNNNIYVSKYYDVYKTKNEKINNSQNFENKSDNNNNKKETSSIYNNINKYETKYSNKYNYKNEKKDENKNSDNNNYISINQKTRIEKRSNNLNNNIKIITNKNNDNKL